VGEPCGERRVLADIGGELDDPHARVAILE
jgi:hypothetical protein